MVKDVVGGSEGHPELGNEYIYGQALAICGSAEKRGVVVRLLGATAFVNHCPKFNYLYEGSRRKLTDVDLMGYSKTPQDKLNMLFKELGYEPIRALGWHAAIRDIFVNERGLHVDVFRDVLSFSHQISFMGRLELDFPTIPLVDLLLEKLQIARITAKDLFDVVVLLLEHDIDGDDDRERIDIGRITSIWTRDWGFHYTGKTNLEKARSYVDEMPMLGNHEKEVVRSRIDEIVQHVEAAPKSLRWKLRSTIGTRMRWYEEVESVER